MPLSTPPLRLMLDMGIHEVTKYAVEPMAHQPFTNIAYYANAEAWKKLPDHLKAVVTAATRVQYLRLRNESHKKEPEAKKFLISKGMKFISFPQKEQDRMAAVAQKLWKVHAKQTPFAGKVIKSMTDYLKKEGRLPANYKLD